MKLNRFLLMLLCLIILSLSACTHTDEMLNIEIVEDESYLVDVEAKDGYVLYYLNVTIANNTSDIRRFKLEGVFAYEFEEGILDSEKCFATTDEGDEVIRIDANGRVENLDIVFKIKMKDGYNGETLKENRLLPKIRIIEL